LLASVETGVPASKISAMNSGGPVHLGSGI
jgi:hypothetical protein